jgi:hypothetical protein
MHRSNIAENSVVRQLELAINTMENEISFTIGRTHRRYIEGLSLRIAVILGVHWTAGL